MGLIIRNCKDMEHFQSPHKDMSSIACLFRPFLQRSLTYLSSLSLNAADAAAAAAAAVLSSPTKLV
jgi:hypothetical protein